jgi:GR25 family glycosyltransferase involved in LPS biosynthesis
LHRVQAIDAEYVVSHAIPGKIRDSEKACILSHRCAIDLARGDGGHSLIVEDDVRFGPSTFRLLGKLGSLLDNFDVVFTDLVLGSIHDMIRFFFLRRELVSRADFQLLDLNGILFSGATAYVVNARSKEKILALIDTLPSCELPYDLQLRYWINAGHLKAGFTFPFLTTLSSHADRSGIQLANFQTEEAAQNAYRRLMWLDFEQTRDNPLEFLDRVDASYFDAQSLCFAQILSVMLSPNYVIK